MAAEFVGKVTEKELEESFQNIKNAYVSQAEEVFEKFGRYLKKNIFLIPPNVVLPEDKAHLDPKAKNYNGTSVQNDLNQMKNLRQEIVNAKYQKSSVKSQIGQFTNCGSKTKRFRETSRTIQK